MSDTEIQDWSDCVDKIEAAYEFMLAYAAQGRDKEAVVGGEGLSIRTFLDDLAQGLLRLDSAFGDEASALAGEAPAELQTFRQRLKVDAEAALSAVRLVQQVPSISSQLIDNLNASVHLRCLLTDIFIVDEALKIFRLARNQEGPGGLS